MNVLAKAIAEPWAITAEGLDLILSVAARENTDVSIEALEAYRAEHVPTAERLKKRGPVAIIEARGPMFRHANLFTAISGATSYDVLRRDLQASLDDPSVRALVLNLDTPGGEVTGVDELAKAIRAGKAKKTIVAYVGGMAASAGYWLASQASEIVIAETAVLGSIGVRAVVQDTSEADAKSGRIEFISSRAPGKRADVASDAGRARIQRTIDALEDVFIETVGAGRNVKADDVVAKFGGGDVLIGKAAVAAGMADRIGDFEAVVSELAGRVPSPSQAPVSRPLGTSTMPEGQRYAATMALSEAQADAKTALHILATTQMEPEAIGELLRIIQQSTQAQLPALIEGSLTAHIPPGGLYLYDAKTGGCLPSDDQRYENFNGFSPYGAPQSGNGGETDRVRSAWSQAIAEVNSRRHMAE